MKEASELRNSSAGDLDNELLALHRELFNLRMQKGVGQAIKPHLFKKIKRQVSRVKTIMGEKEGLLS